MHFVKAVIWRQKWWKTHLTQTGQSEVMSILVSCCKGCFSHVNWKHAWPLLPYALFYTPNACQSCPLVWSRCNPGGWGVRASPLKCIVVHKRPTAARRQQTFGKQRKAALEHPKQTRWNGQAETERWERLSSSGGDGPWKASATVSLQKPANPAKTAASHRTATFGVFWSCGSMSFELRGVRVRWIVAFGSISVLLRSNAKLSYETFFIM